MVVEKKYKDNKINDLGCENLCGKEK